MSKNSGVIAVDFPESGVVQVVFDDTKTSAKRIATSLESAQMTIEGPPKFMHRNQTHTR